MVPRALLGQEQTAEAGATRTADGDAARNGAGAFTSKVYRGNPILREPDIYDAGF